MDPFASPALRASRAPLDAPPGLPDPLRGQGPRPKNPHVAIAWAANRGTGLHLTFEEVWDLFQDPAIVDRAMYVVHPGEAEDVK